MKKLIFTILVTTLVIFNSCKTTTPVPVTYGYGIPSITFGNSNGVNSLCVQDSAFINVDFNTFIDSLKKGYTIKTGGLEFWVGPGLDSTGKVGVKANAKMCVDIK